MASAERFWRITHNPKSLTKPLTIELRQLHEGARLPRDGDKGISDLIGQGACIAQPNAIDDEKARILRVAGRVDEFTGNEVVA